MNFEYSEEQGLLKDSILRWSQDNYSFDQRRVSANSNDGFSRKHWSTFAELGWLSIPFAEDLGGYGGGVVDMAAIMEEVGKALVVEPIVPNLVLFGNLLGRTSSATKADIIPNIINGSAMGAAALYEPQARFDLSNIKTVAARSGDDYTLSGTKSMVLGAPHAEHLLVLARSSGEQTDEHGLSLFLLDPKSSGVTVNAYQIMDGSQAADVVLDNASGQLLDAEGEAYALVMATMNEAHVALCSEALGIMEKLNHTTVAYTKTRKQFGRAISSFQALQHRMVDTFMAYEQAKSLLVGTLVELTDETTEPARAAKMVSALRTIIAKNGKLIGDEAIQLHGGMGLTDELDIGHYVKRLMMINLLFGDADFYQRQFNQAAYAS